MPDSNPDLDQLTTRWHALKRQGQEPSAEDLCADCPEHLDELRKRLRDLASMERFLDVGAPAASQESRSPIDPFQSTVTGRSQDSTANAPPPGTIPNYEILSELGRGGMGVVYLARQVTLRRRVALKMVLAGAHLSPEQRDRFRAEAEAVARLQHPNIVQIFEIGEHEGQPFFSMEYVEGGSLARFLAAGPLPCREAARLIETLARAMQHAHQRGVVHRDLKPGNILMQEEDGDAKTATPPGASAARRFPLTHVPKITDFGLAKRLEDDNLVRTRTGAVLGTPSYMAPEQAEGRTDEVGPPADIYALGTVLYELLAGRPPFRGESMMKTLQQVISVDPAAPSTLRTEIDRDIETICLKALAKEPRQRYSSALALAQDLERYQAGEPIMARRIGPIPRMWRRVRRSPLTAAALLFGLVAVAVTLGMVRQAVVTQERAALRQQIDDGLNQPEWSPDHADTIERLIARGDESEATAARERLLQRYADQVRTALRAPQIHDSDVARLQTDLDWIARRDAELARGLRADLGRRVRSWQPVVELSAPWKNLENVFAADVILGQPTDALRPAFPSSSQTPPVLTRVPASGNIQMEITFDAGWQDVAQIGLYVGTSSEEPWNKRGYGFLLSAMQRPSAEGRAADRTQAASFRKSGHGGEIQISQNNTVLRRQFITIAEGRLTLLVRREDHRLEFRVNNSDPFVFYDPVPLRPDAKGRLAIYWPECVGIQSVRVTAQSQSEQPSPLERGDELYNAGKLAEALAAFEEQVITSTAPDVRRQAQCKAGLCLVQLNRPDAAAAMFEQAAAESDDRWALLALCQLWLIRLEQQKLDESSAVFASVRARFRSEQLAIYVPESLQTKLFATPRLTRTDLVFPSARVLRRTQDAVPLFDLFGDVAARWAVRYDLVRMEALTGNEAKAASEAALLLPISADVMQKLGGGGEARWAGRIYAWMACRQGNAREGARVLTNFADQLRGIQESGGSSRAAPRPEHFLLVELARLQAAQGDWTGAEKSIASFMQGPPELLAGHYDYFAAASLMRGFIEERRGDAAAAQQTWKAALYPQFVARFAPAGAPLDAAPPGGDGLLYYGILASLTNDLTDASAEALWTNLLPMLAGDSAFAQTGAIFRPSSAVLRGMWRASPKARDAARRIAFHDLSMADALGAPIIAGMTEKMRHDLWDARTTPAQDEFLWRFSEKGLARMRDGRISQPQLLQLTLAWKGTTNFLGWGGVAPGLDREFRAETAYLLGYRYRRLGRDRDAANFFATALADADAGSPLRALAQRAIAELSEK